MTSIAVKGTAGGPCVVLWLGLGSQVVPKLFPFLGRDRETVTTALMDGVVFVGGSHGPAVDSWFRGRSSANQTEEERLMLRN